jgi:hypothetical protein
MSSPFVFPQRTMSEEIEILLAAKSFHEMIGDLFDALDAEWLSQVDGHMRPGGKIDLASLGQVVFFEQFRCVLPSMYYDNGRRLTGAPGRFTYLEVQELAIRLDLPEEFVCPQSRIKEDSFTALCMLLRRLASPTRHCDVEMQCGWEAARFSRITRLVAQHIYDRWNIYSVSIQLVSLHTPSKNLPNA